MRRKGERQLALAFRFLLCLTNTSPVGGRQAERLSYIVGQALYRAVARTH